MTILGLTNYILQIFFIRLTKHEERVITGFKMTSFSVGYGPAGQIKSSETHKWYSLQYWVIPFTGWNTDFKYIGKAPRFKRITKISIHENL